MKIRKKSFVLIITYLTAAVIALSAYCWAMNSSGEAYRRTAKYGYSHAFSEVVQSVESLDTALKKGQYAAGSEVSAQVCAELCGSCQAASMSMAVLPFSTQELERTAAFVNITEDYAEYLLKTTGETGFSDTERENMALLSQVSGSLKKSLNELNDRINDGDILMDEPESVFASENENTLSREMLNMEAELSELPTVDYNGSYATLAAVEYGEPLSESAAKKAAEEFFGITATDTQYKTEDGVFCFAFDGGTVTVDAGGNVLSMSSQRSVAGDMEDAELIKAAEVFLSERGFENMKMSASERHDSVLTATFSGTVKGVLCENDCIRVSVAADDGSIYAFDATEFYNHSRERTIDDAAVNEAEAKCAVPSNLTVKKSELVLCKDNGLERLCYAFDCESSEGDQVRICVDAATGKQFKIELK